MLAFYWNRCADMLWFIYALIAAITSGIKGVLTRFVVKDHDILSYGFLFNILAATFFIPLMIMEFSLPESLYAWEVAGLGIALWTVVSLIGFKATQLVEISLKDSLGQIRLIFLLIMSSIFLSEPMTSTKIIGTLLILFGTIVLTYKGKIFGKITDTGIQLTLVASFLMAVTAIVDKVALSYWNVPTYSFVAFFFPGLIMGAFTLKRVDKLSRMIKKKLLPTIMASLLIVVSAYFMFRSYQLTDVSNVFPILRLSTLVGVLGGIVFLRERKDVPKKIFGVLVMIVGAILIQG